MGPVEAASIHQFSEARRRLLGGYGNGKRPFDEADLTALIKHAVEPFQKQIISLQKQVDSLVATLADTVDRVVDLEPLSTTIVDYGDKIAALESVFPVARPDSIKDVKVEYIVKLVADHEGLTPIKIKSRRRDKKLCRARNIVYYLCTEYTGKSLPTIAKALDDRDHTTIMHGARAITYRRPSSKKLDEDLKWYEARLAALTGQRPSS